MNTAFQGRIAKCRQNKDTSLELNGECVDDDTLAQLYGHGHLKELHIVGAAKVTNVGLTYLENLTKLEWLNLDGVAINDRGLFFLQQMSRLKGLQLTNAFLTGCGLEHLVTLKTLEYLELDGTNVDDNSMQSIAKIKSLKTLRLCSTAVTDKGVFKLQNLKKLKSLFLYDSHVSQASIQKLRKYMPKCEIRWSAYAPRKPMPAPLPPLFFPRTLPQWARTIAPPEVAVTPMEPGTFLKLIYEKNKIEIELKRLNKQQSQPHTKPQPSRFKVVPPAWIDLLDWKDESRG